MRTWRRGEVFEVGVASSVTNVPRAWWVSVKSRFGRAMKSSSRAAVMRPRIAGNLRHTS